MTVFLALQEAFKAVPNPQATVKFCQRISPMLKDAPANYSGLRKEYEVRDLNFFFIYNFSTAIVILVHRNLRKKCFTINKLKFTQFEYLSCVLFVLHIKDRNKLH